MSDRPLKPIKRFWFDTEFMEDGKTIELLSIGIVDEDGREFYAEDSDAHWVHANPWVRENVIPKLCLPMYGRSRFDLRMDILEFIGPDVRPQFWAYFGSYDWVVLCQLFGTMMDLPDGWPMFPMDLKQYAVMAGVTDLHAFEPEPEDAHNALVDARWTKRAYDALTQRLAGQVATRAMGGLS